MPLFLTRNKGFYLLAAGLYAFLTIPRMAQAGMFGDGLMYAAVARNLAQGIGSFWFPSFSATIYQRFFEQPPLGMGLQAIAFAVFGDHLAVERVFSLVVGVGIALLLLALWRQTMGERDYDWLPLLFWMVPASITWAIVNNMLENTQALFTTLAVLAFVKSLTASRATWIWSSVAGAAVAAACLTKGPVGLFPLAAPAILAVVHRDRRSKAIRSGAVMVAVFAAIAVATWTLADARASLTAYIDTQLMATLAGTRSVSASRWTWARHLGAGVVLRMAGLLLIIAAMMVMRRKRPAAGSPAWTMFFLLLAMAASLPIALSVKVSGHYFVASVPLYALAFAGLGLPLVKALEPNGRAPRTELVAAGAGIVLLIGTIALPLAGTTYEPRDVEHVAEYRSLALSLPRGETIGTCEFAIDEVNLHVYMQRFYGISLDSTRNATHPHFLQLLDRPCEVPAGCQLMSSTRRLQLFECR